MAIRANTLVKTQAEKKLLQAEKLKKSIESKTKARTVQASSQPTPVAPINQDLRIPSGSSKQDRLAKLALREQDSTTNAFTQITTTQGVTATREQLLAEQQNRAKDKPTREQLLAEQQLRAKAKAPLPVPEPNVVDKTLDVISKVTSAANPFARTFDLVNKQVQQHTEEGSIVNNIFDSVVAATDTSRIEVQSLLRGATQLLGSFGSLLGIDDTKFQQALTDSEIRDRTLSTNIIKKNPIAGNVGKVAGILGPAVISGLGTLGLKATLGVRTGALAAENAAFGLAQFTGEGGSKVGQAVVGGLTGALIPGGGALASKATKFGKGLLTPKAAALNEVVETGTQALNQPGARANIKAAEDLGTFVTPAEAGGSKVSGGAEGRLATNLKLQRTVEEEIITREATASGAFDDLVRSVVPEGEELLAKNVDILYKESLPTVLPVRITDKFKNNEVIQEAIAEASRKAVNKKALEAFPDNTVGRYNIAKTFLDDARDAALDAGKKNEARLIGEEIRGITDSIDAVVPVYSLARSEAQRGIVQRKIIERMEGLKDQSAKSMFNEFFSTEAKINKTFGALSPESIELAHKVGQLLKSLNASKLQLNLARSTNKDIGRIADFNVQISNFIRNLFVGRRNKEIIRLITNPQWVKQVDLINKMPLKQKAPALLVLLEIAAKTAGKSGQAITLRDTANRPEGSF